MTEVGSVSVDVVPNARDFWDTFKAQSQSGAFTTGQSLGDTLGDSAGAEARARIQAQLENLKGSVDLDMGSAEAQLAALQATLDTSGGEGGVEYGDSFSKSLKSRISAALASLPNADVDLNLTPAEAKLAELRAQLAGLSDSSFAGLGIDDATTLRVLAQVRADLDSLTAPEHDIRVRLDAAAASSELAALEAQVAKLNESASTASSSTTTAVKAADTGVTDLAENIKSAAIPALLALSPAIIPFAAVGGGALATVALGASGLEKQITTGLGPAFHDLEATATAALGPDISAAIGELQQALPKLDPLLDTFGSEIGDVADQIATWLNHGGLQDFVNYAEKELPVVESTFEALGQAGATSLRAILPVANDLAEGLAASAMQLDSILQGMNDPKLSSNSFEDLGASFGVGFQGLSSTLSFLDNLGGGSKGLDSIVTKLNQVKAASAAAAAQSPTIGADPGQIAASTAALAGLAQGYDITTSAAEAYANMLGITSDEISSGAVNVKQLSSALDIVKAAYTGANQSQETYLAAVQTFAQSAGTAADKAALISATLVNAQGDALGYGAAISGAYAATQNLASGFDKAEKSAINLKTGTIDYTKAGAGPLIQSLQAMQTAAANAASATFQHELATKGASTAAADAATVFQNETSGALTANAKQLGLTRDQAQKLSDTYFNMPANVTTQVQSIGLSDVNTTLDAIGQQLSYLTGKPFNVAVTADTSQASSALDALRTKMENLPSVADVSNVTANGKIIRQAAGGYIAGPGTGTSDSIPAFLSNGEFVMPAAQTAANRSLLEALRSGQPLTAASSAVAATYSAPVAAVAAAQPLPPQVINLVVDGRVLAKVVNERNMGDMFRRGDPRSVVR